MTTGEMTPGERMEQKHRRRFWMNLAIVAVPAVPLGFITGRMVLRDDEGILHGFQSLPPSTAILLVVAFVATMVVGTYLFAKAIDEVELQDNLWASAFGYYAYMVGFPVWWILGTAGVTRPANDWIIYAVALLSGTAAYFYRKWRAR